MPEGSFGDLGVVTVVVAASAYTLKGMVSYLLYRTGARRSRRSSRSSIPTAGSSGGL
ncbi:hypothetical protein [Streptomyces avermitilis]|uniref:hypothetical protein n=1 Tax=Streptomyces avermitilis TaxID=33903 RepID=UPI0015C4AEEF|nr:hypothetical protein [Streptomyces avermitilis]